MGDLERRIFFSPLVRCHPFVYFGWMRLFGRGIVLLVGRVTIVVCWRP